MVKRKVVIGVFRHAESKSSLSFVLPLLLHRVLATFQSKLKAVFAGIYAPVSGQAQTLNIIVVCKEYYKRGFKKQKLKVLSWNLFKHV